MSRYLIGYFSRRQFFHIVAYRDSDEEVQAYLNTHNSKKLVVYASQQNAHADGAGVCPNCKREWRFHDPRVCSVPAPQVV